MSINLKSFLENIDKERDKLLSGFIIKYWPRPIMPNHLTITRMVLATILAVLLFTGFVKRIWIIPLFCVAAIMDLLDGSVARTLNEKTKLGAFLDPIADKFLVIPLMLFSFWANYKLLFILLILPEIISASVAGYYNIIKKTMTKPNIFGKTKMVLECFGFGILLVSLPGPPHQISIFLFYLAVIFAFIGCFIKPVQKD